MPSAFHQKFGHAVFAATAALSAMAATSAFAAEAPQTGQTQKLEDAQLAEARTELQKRLEYALNPSNSNSFSRFLSVQSLVERYPSYPTLAMEAIQGLGKAFRIAPMKDWADLIETIVRIAYLDVNTLGDAASLHILNAVQNAMNALDVDNLEIRENVLKVMAKASQYVPETHARTYPHLQAALSDTSPEGFKAADIVLDFLTAYTTEMVVSDPAELEPFYAILKDRMEPLRATETSYENADPEKRYELSNALYAVRHNIAKTVRAYGFTVALLPDKATEAVPVLEQLLKTSGADETYTSALFSSLSHIGIKHPEQARSIVDMMLPYAKSGQAYSALNVISAIGRAHKEEADYVIEAVMKQAGEGHMFYSVDAIRRVAKVKPAEEEAVVNKKVMRFLLDEFKKGRGMGDTLYLMRQEALADKGFAAEWLAAAKALPDEQLIYWRLVDEIYTFGTQSADHRADAQEILTRLLNKSIQDQNFVLAQSLAEKISSLKNIKEPAPAKGPEFLRMPGEDGDLIPSP